VVEPTRLPRAERATIPTGKLVGYALSPERPLGRHKARILASALGIMAAEWRYLHDQILGAVLTHAVRSTRITPLGIVYEVVVPIDGLNGASLRVATWIIAGDAPRVDWLDPLVRAGLPEDTGGIPHVASHRLDTTRLHPGRLRRGAGAGYSDRRCRWMGTVRAASRECRVASRVNVGQSPLL
jgi:hypothetical protein